MNALRLSKPQIIYLIGDTLILALVTVIGAAQHNTLGSGMGHLLATFVPMLIAWLLTAPFLGAFDPQKMGNTSQLWRPFWAMILAAPLGTLLRGLWLGRPIDPIFVIVIGGISALSLLGWRAVARLYTTRWLRSPHG
jgi:hypothetical protein